MIAVLEGEDDGRASVGHERVDLLEAQVSNAGGHCSACFIIKKGAAEVSRGNSKVVVLRDRAMHVEGESASKTILNGGEGNDGALEGDRHRTKVCAGDP